MPVDLCAAAGAALLAPDAVAMAEAATALHAGVLAGAVAVPAGGSDAPVLDPRTRPRPARPPLVAPRDLPRRGPTSAAGRAAAIHAVAHIEANAVALALDAAHRFRGLPAAYYADWVAVAADEARHLAMLRGRLHDLDVDYGDLPAHDGLWEACVRTADDVLRRMALVPRVLEARGLDVNPPMIARFRAAGDDETAAVLEVILGDEVGHVAVGDRWFRHACAARGLEPEATFRRLLAESGTVVRPPLNVAARLAAGFGADELTALAAGTRPGAG